MTLDDLYEALIDLEREGLLPLVWHTTAAGEARLRARHWSDSRVQIKETPPIELFGLPVVTGLAGDETVWELEDHRGARHKIRHTPTVFQAHQPLSD